MSKVKHDSGSTSWLLLIHQIPPKPDYLRVKIGRRLQKIGAVPVKNSVYCLPDRAETLEDFQWVRAEIIEGGGDASICKAEFVDGLTNDQLSYLFQSARDADYAEIAESARDAWRAARSREADTPSTRGDDGLGRLRKRLASIRSVDFFNAPGRAMADEAIRTLAKEVEGPPSSDKTSAKVEPTDFHGRLWVTRSGIFVDRIASAWLIRRFIDREARFKFIASAKHRRSSGELRFDMVDGDFTHVGDRCTFETLLDRFGLTDRALHAIAEIVHDIDLKDEKFGRADAAGIERVLSAMVATHADDEARLTRGSHLFDDLYALFSASR